MEQDAALLSVKIKDEASRLGFDLCGIAKAGFLHERAAVLRRWCDDGMNAAMGYLARDVEKRADPRSLLPEASSVIVTALSYNTAVRQKEPGVPVISRYVYGHNYHDAVKGRLEKLRDFIVAERPGTRGLVYADSGPVIEKGWAVEAGLGWQGRHSVVINRDIGSFFFIGVLITDAVLKYDEPHSEDLCGSCRICIDSCPTRAINENHTIDARKCIANLTIENRGPVPEEILPLTGRRVYGCDICQEVCPWNHKAPEHRHPEFELPDAIRDMTPAEWLDLSEDRFRILFGNSEIARKKYGPFMRNIKQALGETEDRRGETGDRTLIKGE